MTFADRFRDAWTALRGQGNGATFVRSSDPTVLELLGPQPAASGMYVTPESAQRVSAVYACVDRIAGGISTLPCKIYKREGAVRREDLNHPFWWLLNEQPSDAWTAASHWSRSLQYVLLRGDSFSLIKRNAAGTPNEIVPVPWDCVTVQRDSLALDARNIYVVNDGYTAKGYDQDDILHFPGYGFNGLHSMSVLSWGARNAAGNAMAMDEYSGRFFADGAHPSIILKTDKKMSDAGQDSLKKAFTDKYAGVRNAHKLPLVLTEGLTAQEISLSAQDSQLLEARKFQVIDIARAFGVPPHLIGETSASTSWGSGIESMGRAFVLFTLQPHLKRIEQELNRKLFRTAATFIEFDRSALIEGDLAAQAQYYRASLGGPGTGQGWMTVNEVRQRQYMEPVDDGKAIFDPNKQPAKPAADPMANVLQALDVLRAQIANQAPPSAPVVNVTSAAPVVTVDNHFPEQAPPVVHVTNAAPVVTVENKLPEQPPAVVNVTVPETQVHIEAVMPEQPAPVVNIVNNIEPSEVNVTLPARKIEGTITRDSAGNITKTTQIETDL